MISYIGGKARIGKWIQNYIPSSIETYVEGFSGMFWVFFNMDLKKYPNLKTVVYNDFNRLNTNLLKWVKQYDTLWDALRLYPCQQLNVVDTPPEYEQMFNEYQKEVFNPFKMDWKLPVSIFMFYVRYFRVLNLKLHHIWIIKGNIDVKFLCSWTNLKTQSIGNILIE